MGCRRLDKQTRLSARIQPCFSGQGRARVWGIGSGPGSLDRALRSTSEAPKRINEGEETDVHTAGSNARVATGSVWLQSRRSRAGIDTTERPDCAVGAAACSDPARFCLDQPPGSVYTAIGAWRWTRQGEDRRNPAHGSQLAPEREGQKADQFSCAECRPVARFQPTAYRRVAAN